MIIFNPRHFPLSREFSTKIILSRVNCKEKSKVLFKLHCMVNRNKHSNSIFDSDCTIQVNEISIKTLKGINSSSGGKKAYLTWKYYFTPIHFIMVLACVRLVVQLYLTLCDPVDCSLPGPLSLVILQARILKWVAMPFSRGSSQPRDRAQVSHIAGRFFTIWATREALTVLAYWFVCLF